MNQCLYNNKENAEHSKVPKPHTKHGAYLSKHYNCHLFKHYPVASSDSFGCANLCLSLLITLQVDRHYTATDDNMKVIYITKNTINSNSQLRMSEINTASPRMPSPFTAGILS